MLLETAFCLYHSGVVEDLSSDFCGLLPKAFAIFLGVCSIHARLGHTGFVSGFVSFFLFQDPVQVVSLLSRV